MTTFDRQRQKITTQVSPFTLTIYQIRHQTDSVQLRSNSMRLNVTPRPHRPCLGQKKPQVQRTNTATVNALKDCNIYWVNVFFDSEDKMMSDMALLERIEGDLEAHLAVVSDTCLMASRPLCISIEVCISEFTDPLDVEDKIFKEAVVIVQRWMRNLPAHGMPFHRNNIFERAAFANRSLNPGLLLDCDCFK